MTIDNRLHATYGSDPAATSFRVLKGGRSAGTLTFFHGRRSPIASLPGALKTFVAEGAAPDITIRTFLYTVLCLLLAGGV